jgi:4a-hydroxytetrahydrobiopterin dehydratase
MAGLSQQHCRPPAEGLQALEREAITRHLQQLPEWRLAGDGDSIEREFRFEDFYQTIAFVNAVAWIANREDHHPDLQVGYNRCLVRYRTHAVDGLSLNDFICAARIDQLNQ